VRPADLAAVGAPPAAVTLRNPMTEEQSAMRTSLLPGLLHAFARSCRHGERDGWLSRARPADVWDAKGLAQGFVHRLIRREATVTLARDDRPAALHPRGAAWVEVNGRRVGSFGPLHPDVADRFEVGAAMLVELDLAAL